jgi:hypothetical protein
VHARSDMPTKQNDTSLVVVFALVQERTVRPDNMLTLSALDIVSASDELSKPNTMLWASRQ